MDVIEIRTDEDWGGSFMADVLLSEFKPKSELVVAQHEVTKPRFPVIDFHAHLWNVSADDVRTIAGEMGKYGVCGLVNLTGSTGDALDGILEATGGLQRKIITFSSVDARRLDEPGFADYASQTIREAYGKGVRGLKFFKSLSLGIRDSKGKHVPADTPRLKPIWDTAAELGIPVLIHIADPMAFFRPIGPENERIEELGRYPDWSFTDPDMFTFDELMRQQEGLIAGNPATTFVVAHVGSAGENLGLVSRMMRKYENMHVDMAARISELGRQPYSAKQFLTEFQDRILFGTDIDTGTLMGSGHELYPYYYRFLETMDEYFDYGSNPIQGRWRIYGIGLEDGILEKIYCRNAVRLVPEFSDCIGV